MKLIQMIWKTIVRIAKHIDFLEREKQKIRKNGFGSHDG
jgi:hypothetical protein